jgi:hypothetical protein
VVTGSFCRGCCRIARRAADLGYFANIQGWRVDMKPAARGVTLYFRSELAASHAQVWAHATAMPGVNQELHPWVHMTAPAEFAQMSLLDAQVEEATRPLLFRSVLMAFCCIPFDVHSFHLDRIIPDEGFDERSTSWMQKVWIHRRRILPMANGCVVTDELVIEPRIGFMKPVVGAVVGFLFRHRHRRLAAHFSGLPAR